MMILRGTLPVPLAQTAEGAPISSVFWGDRPSRKQIGYRMSLNAPLHHPIPYRRNPRRRTVPASFGISTWRRSRTPTACRGAGTQDRARPTPDGLSLKHLAEAARAGRDAVALARRRSGTPRLAFALAVALIRPAVPPRDCGT